ncbi:Rab-GTPase-TBC domain protein [Ceratobasidium sp. AG-Ba]|nr:Rab-GTPase-TBC domain protein [Ceratobasidium sp. AG-Ba]
MTASEIIEASKSGSSSQNSRPSSKRAPTLNTLSRAATTTANITPATATTSPPSSSTVRKLLDQLTALHDTQQAAQKAEWDVFLKRRRQGGGGAFLGFMSKVDGEESDEEESGAWLVRNGIPLVYRGKVWSECSGAAEMREPGVFGELLSSHIGQDSPTLKEIEKDVVRTMPLNVFFGGDGVGVSKLRRVLQAYSWRDPELGYCQGMNLITSTLLLVYPEKKMRFGYLQFFSGSLIDSRACPLVLLDYVEIHHPKVYAHLLDLNVDLPAICFSWFLSLYTDCLPVETLFRVWDLMFAEGLDALFRIGLAIIRINEPELLACDSTPTLYQYLEGMTARMWQADKLMKVESEVKGLMPHDELVRRREAHVAMLQSYA